MSIQAMSWVLTHSTTTNGQRLVLLSLANHADETGAGAWPSIETMMRETRLGRTAVTTALREMREAELIVPSGKKRRVVVYSIAMNSPVSHSEGCQNPDTNRPKPRERDESLSPGRTDRPGGRPPEWAAAWGAVVEFFGEPQTAAERGDVANTVRSICEPLTGLQPERIRQEVRRRRAAYWPGLTVSHRALRTQWGTLGTAADRMTAGGGGYREIQDGEA